MSQVIIVIMKKDIKNGMNDQIKKWIIKKNSKDGEFTSDVSDNDDENKDHKYNRENGLKDYVIDFALNIQFAKDDPYRKRN